MGGTPWTIIVFKMRPTCGREAYRCNRSATFPPLHAASTKGNEDEDEDKDEEEKDAQTSIALVPGRRVNEMMEWTDRAPMACDRDDNAAG